MEHNLFQLKFVFGIIAIQIAFALMTELFQHFADAMPSRSIESHTTTDNCKVLIIHSIFFLIYLHTCAENGNKMENYELDF